MGSPEGLNGWVMPTVTLTSKGQLTIPRVRQGPIDRQGRLVLVPSKDEPEDLCLNRPKLARVLSENP